MSIQLAGDLAGTKLVDVDAGYRTAHVGIFPIDGNHYRMFSASGATTALSALAPIFSFRNISTNTIAIQNISIAATCTTGFTTAQRVGALVYIARNWTSSDTAGATIALTGNTNKLRTSQTTLTSADMRIATTTALTAGTRTLDTTPIDGIYGYAPATAGIAIASNNVYQQVTTGHPIVLAQNEGIVIVNARLLGAAGVIIWDIGMEFVERTAY